ncbi:MAG: hypothetical protein PHI48_11150 [Bacteroidales bacterium]|nr:hypothetical protein [Bacteroidales bacterium]
MKRTLSAFGWMFLAGIALLSSCTTDDEDLFPDNTDNSQTKITLKLKVTQANQLKNIAFLGTYFSVNWGDGVDQNFTAPNQEKSIPHTYAASGEYTVIITGKYISRLDIAGIDATQLTLTKAPSLKQLYCQENELSSLDLQNADSITTVVCSSNNLTSINATGLKMLQLMNCGTNKLSTLSLSGCSSLSGFQVESNPLVHLNLTNCSSLYALSVYRTQNDSLPKLETLVLKGCTSLVTLKCERNSLTSLDVTECDSLNRLTCFSNKLTSISLNNPELRSLDCYYNKLSTNKLAAIVNALPELTPTNKGKICLIAEKSLEDTPDETNEPLSEEAINILASKNWTLTNQWH